MDQFFSTFFLYSFLGFLIEVAYTRLCHHPKQDRKCLLFLPLCPVYGLGALAVLSLPALLLRRPLLVFLAGALVANLKSGDRSQGASTITQQLIKNKLCLLYTSPSPRD